MPQLMPFYWVNSVFVIVIILMTLIILYFYKNMDYMINVNQNKEMLNMFYFKW